MLRRGRQPIRFLRTPRGLLTSAAAAILAWVVIGPRLTGKPPLIWVAESGRYTRIDPIYIVPDRTGGAKAHFPNEESWDAATALDRPLEATVVIQHLSSGWIYPTRTRVRTAYLPMSSQPLSNEHSELMRLAAPDVARRINDLYHIDTALPAPGTTAETFTTPSRTAIVANILAAISLLPLGIACTAIPRHLRNFDRPRRLAANRCPTCNYDWSATTGPCPECNTPRPTQLESPR